MASDRGGSGTAASVALRSLTSHVLGLANEAHRVLARAGRFDLAARMDEESRRWRSVPVMVLVAGEVKRGKSSLINALVERPGLLPVGAAVPTAAPLFLSWAAEPGVTVERWVEGLDEPERVEVDLDDLNRNASDDAPEGVRRIDVRLPAAVLEDGLLLVDTPGIGSMSAGHRDLALGLLHHADALLFVTSAEEPLLRSEAEFLAGAAGRVAEVEIVVTKTDLVAEPTELVPLLERRIEELARVVPQPRERLNELAARAPMLTSSLLAERSRSAADAERAASLARRAGVDGLQAALRRLVDDRTRIRLANVAQTTEAVSTLALRELRGGDSQSTDDRAPLPRSRWRQALGSSLSRVASESQRELTGHLNDLESRYRQQVKDATDLRALTRDLPTELEQAVLGVWLDVLAATEARLRAAVEELSAAIDADVSFDESHGELPDRVRQATAGRQLEPPKPKPDPIDHGLPALTTSMVLGGGVLLTLLGPVGAVLGAAAGSGTVAVRVLRQAKARSREQAAVAVAEAVREARHELSSELQAALNDRRQALELAVDAALAAPAGSGRQREGDRESDVSAALTRIGGEARAIRLRLAARAPREGDPAVTTGPPH
jgi:hypothetical protein